MTDADLRQMIERMALHQLAEEQRRCAAPRRASRTEARRASRSFGTLHAC
jgi:hypothetical protein